MRFLKNLLLFSLLVMGFACQQEKEKNQNQIPEDLLSQRAFLAFQPLLSPQTIGQKIVFTFSISDSSKKLDSLVYFIDNEAKGGESFIPKNTYSLAWETQSASCGQHQFRVEAKQNGQVVESASQQIFLKSDLVPETYNYEVIKTLPHEPSSYTQGLEWKNNTLYEGTGLNGKSALIQVDPATGKALQKVSLAQEFFGEGITILGNELYQITWQNKKGFVYELPGLNKIREFSYPTDGWGLSTWKGLLAMTDGGNTVYFYEAQSMTRKRKIEVWDNKFPVSELNELENAENGIWANKYTTDSLVKFDPETGKVLAYLDLSGILKKKDETGNEDVLNGIAYRPDENLYYVTGKNWPKMFAIRLIKKKAI
jgi:glutaminyl-peptide cyclotransferase